MTIIHNIYCDESAHLEKDNKKFMVLGGLACPNHLKDEIFKRLKAIRKEHGIQTAEMKWNKVAHGKKEAYRNLINYFFDKDDLYFRAIVIDKTKLNHMAFAQNHDDFYYKMYFQLLQWFLEPDKKCNIYLDIKDTQGNQKINRLKEVLCNAHYDFNQDMINRIQEIHSHEVVLMQLTDLLIGAINYTHHFPSGGESTAKNELVNLIKERSECTLIRSTVLGARKFNIFCWEAR